MYNDYLNNEWSQFKNDPTIKLKPLKKLFFLSMKQKYNIK